MSKKTKILVLGSSGVVGYHMHHEFSKSYDVVSAANSWSGADFLLDATDYNQLEKVVADSSPEVIINAIKPPMSTDMMEEQKERAYSSNVGVVEHLVILKNTHNFKIVHISSDWVYKGSDGELYSEDSELFSHNYYSESKILAEKVLTKNTSDSLILRTEGVFGYDVRGSNLFMRLRSSKKDATFSLPNDQFAQPIYSGELAILARMLLEDEKSGIFNSVGKDYVSRYDFGLMVKDAFNLDVTLNPCTCLGRQIPIPQFLKIDVSKIESATKQISPLSKQLVDLKEFLSSNSI
jgi:dTDP-4-dehydrorhamnose reductase